MKPERFILASGSPRRSAFLRDAGLRFEIVTADVEEIGEHLEGGAGLVAHNARLKGLVVAKKYPKALVLAADTTVDLDGVVYNKPKDMNEARAMLLSYSERSQKVFTATCFCLGGEVIEHVEESRVCFRKLDSALVERYIQAVNPLDRAGAYSIQDHGDLIIERFEGSHSNVAGLPMEYVLKTLKAHGWYEAFAKTPRDRAD